MGQLTAQLGTTVYLDTNIIIYAVEGHETHVAPIKSLLQGLTEREIIGVTSDLTLAEVLVKPKRDGNAKLEDAYRRFLLPTESMRNSAVSREILESMKSMKSNAGKPAEGFFREFFAERCVAIKENQNDQASNRSARIHTDNSGSITGGPGAGATESGDSHRGAA